MKSPPTQSTRERLLAPPQSPEVLRRLAAPPPHEVDSMGVSLDVPGHVLVYSPARHMTEMRAKRNAAEAPIR